MRQNAFFSIFKIHSLSRLNYIWEYCCTEISQSWSKIGQQRQGERQHSDVKQSRVSLNPTHEIHVSPPQGV